MTGMRYRDTVTSGPMSLLTPASPGTTLRTKGLTLLQIDQRSDRLFTAIQTCVPGEERWPESFHEAKRLCQIEYRKLYPEYALDEVEPYDNNACLLYSRSADGEISGTLRVCFDAAAGLPLESSLPDDVAVLRRCGLRLAEPGRFVIPDGRLIYKAYLSAAYQIARLCEVDVYLMQLRSEHTNFYRRNCGAVVLDSALAPPGCTNVSWNIERTPERFFRAVGTDQSHLRTFLSEQE